MCDNLHSFRNKSQNGMIDHIFASQVKGTKSTLFLTRKDEVDLEPLACEDELINVFPKSEVEQMLHVS